MPVPHSSMELDLLYLINGANFCGTCYGISGAAFCRAPGNTALPAFYRHADGGQCGGIVLDADCFVIGDLQAFNEGPDIFYCSGFVMEAFVRPGCLIAIGPEADNVEFAGFAFYDM